MGRKLGVCGEHTDSKKEAWKGWRKGKEEEKVIFKLKIYLSTPPQKNKNKWQNKRAQEPYKYNEDKMLINHFLNYHILPLGPFII